MSVELGISTSPSGKPTVNRFKQRPLPHRRVSIFPREQLEFKCYNYVFIEVLIALIVFIM